MNFNAYNNIRSVLKSVIRFAAGTTISTGETWSRRTSILSSKSKENGGVSSKLSDQTLQSATIMIKDLVCYMSLLEAGTVEEKLECM